MAQVSMKGMAEIVLVPLDGQYCRYEYPNWATKFLVDSSMLKADIIEPTTGPVPSARVELGAPARYAPRNRPNEWDHR